MKNIIIALTLLIGCFSYSQVSVAESFAIKALTTTQRNTMTTTARYPIVYNSTTAAFERFNGTSWERWTAGVTSADITDGVIDELDLDASVNASLDLADSALQSLTGVTSANITDGTIDILDLDAGLTTSLGLADSALQSLNGVTSANITDGTIDILDMDAGVTTSLGLADTSIQSLNGVTSANITDGTIDILDVDAGITSSLGLADSSIQSLNGVTSANITDGTIDELDLDISVNASLDLADTSIQSLNGITSANITDGTIALADLSATGTASASTYLRGDNTWATVAGGGLASTDIDTSAELSTILTDETGSGAAVFATSPTLVTPALGTPSALVLTNATGLVSAGIVDGTIATIDLADDAVTGDKILDNTITGTNISTDAIVTSLISNNAVTTDKIINSAVTSAKIADGTIVNADINASAAIGGTKVAFTPVGSIAATDMETAVTELYTEYGTLIGDNSAAISTNATDIAAIEITLNTVPSSAFTTDVKTADYTFVAGDVADNKIIALDYVNETATIPADIFTVGNILRIKSISSTIANIVAGAGVTFPSLSLYQDNQSVSLKMVSTNVWEIEDGKALSEVQWIPFMVSTMGGNIAVGTAKAYVYMPFGFKVSAVKASLWTAPTGSTAIFDININGATILSTKLSIDATEFHTSTAATPAVISSTTSYASDSYITIDIDQVGSTVTGASGIVYVGVIRL